MTLMFFLNLYQITFHVVIIAMIVHPVIVEILLTVMKFGMGLQIVKFNCHPFYDHSTLFTLEVSYLFQVFLLFLL